MRINSGDNINTAIKKICAESTRAGSVVVLIQREFPDTTMDYLKAIDEKGLYGAELADCFFRDCSADLATFLSKISNG